MSLNTDTSLVGKREQAALAEVAELSAPYEHRAFALEQKLQLPKQVAKIADRVGLTTGEMVNFQRLKIVHAQRVLLYDTPMSGEVRADHLKRLDLAEKKLTLSAQDAKLIERRAEIVFAGENAQAVTDGCQGVSSGLQGLAALAYLSGSPKVGKALANTSKAVDAVGVVNNSIEALKNIGSGIMGGVAAAGHIGAIVGALSSVITMFGDDVDIGEERHKEVMEKLHQMETNILDTLSQHHDIMMDCFEKLEQEIGLQLTTQQEIILAGFSAVIRDQNRTKETLQRHHKETMQRLNNIQTTQVSTHEAQSEHLVSIEGMLTALAEDGLKRDLAKAKADAATSLSEDRYQDLFSTLYSIAKEGSTGAVLTGDKIDTSSDAVVAPALEKDPLTIINLVKNCLNIQRPPLPNIHLWNHTVSLLETAIRRRINEKRPLDKSQHTPLLKEILQQGIDFTLFVNTAGRQLPSLFTNYQKQVAAFHTALQQATDTFEAKEAEKLEAQTQDRITQEQNALTTSYASMSVTTHRTSPQHYPEDTDKQAKMRQELDGYYNYYDHHRNLYEPGVPCIGYYVQYSSRNQPFFHAILGAELADKFKKMFDVYDPSKIGQRNWGANAVMACVKRQNEHEGNKVTFPDNQRDPVDRAIAKKEFSLLRNWLNRYYAPVVKEVSVSDNAAAKKSALGRFAAEEAKRMTGLITGDGVPLPIARFGSLCPPRASEAVKAKWALAEQAGTLKHKYTAGNDLEITTTVESVVVAKWKFPNWRAGIHPCYGKDEALHYFFNQSGMSYQKPVDKPSSTNQGYGAHAPISLDKMEEVATADTTAEINQIIERNTQRKQEALKAFLVEQLRTPSTSLHYARQQLNISERLIKAVRHLAYPTTELNPPSGDDFASAVYTADPLPETPGQLPPLTLKPGHHHGQALTALATLIDDLERYTPSPKRGIEELTQQVAALTLALKQQQA